MRDYYSVQTLFNLVSWPVTSRFADHLSAVSESSIEGSGSGSGSGSGDGHHNFNSPIHQDHGCNLFPSCLSCPLSACKEDLDPKALKRELRWYRHLRTTPAQSAA